MTPIRTTHRSTRKKLPTWTCLAVFAVAGALVPIAHGLDGTASYTPAESNIAGK